MNWIKVRLALMMCLQYFIWGAWGVQMGTYLNADLKFSAVDIGKIYATTAMASIVSPLCVGFLADRVWAAEKLLGCLHLLGAGAFALAAGTTQPGALFGVMLISQLAYVPTIGLTNAVCFAHTANPEKDFPVIRACAAPGWIGAGWIVGFILSVKPGNGLYGVVTTFLSPDGPLLQPNSFLYMTAFASALLGAYAFTLPHTPPACRVGIGSPASTTDRLLLGVLLRDRSFQVFLACAFLICIPLSFYYALANAFLDEIDAPYPTALQTMGQVSEALLMVVMPWFISQLGIKRMLFLGMLAWLVRYLCFAAADLSLVIMGLLLHSVCYDFFFVASQIYVDKKVDTAQRATAQSLFSVITLGLGMMVGSLLSGVVADYYAPILQPSVVEAWGLERREVPIRIDELPEQIVLNEQAADGESIYARTDLTATLRQVDQDQNQEISRTELLAGQRKQWFYIWLWPGLGATVVACIFWIFFQERAS